MVHLYGVQWPNIKGKYPHAPLGASLKFASSHSKTVMDVFIEMCALYIIAASVNILVLHSDKVLYSV